jgi:hypothetical protein
MPVIVISPTGTGNGSGGGGNNGTVGIEACAQGLTPAATSYNVTPKPTTRSVLSGTSASSTTDLGQSILGNSVIGFSNEQRLIDTTNTAITSAQQNPRGSVGQELNR